MYYNLIDNSQIAFQHKACICNSEQHMSWEHTGCLQTTNSCDTDLVRFTLGELYITNTLFGIIHGILDKKILQRSSVVAL